MRHLGSHPLLTLRSVALLIGARRCAGADI